MPQPELSALAKIAIERRRAGAAEAARNAAAEAAIRTAREANVSWAEIGETLGISEGQAKWLVQRHLTPEAQARQEGDVPRTAPRPGRGPGVGVTEAARRLGVTRRTIYAWTADGRLQTTKNELGKTRILLPENEPANA